MKFIVKKRKKKKVEMNVEEMLKEQRHTSEDFEDEITGAVNRHLKHYLCCRYRKVFISFDIRKMLKGQYRVINFKSKIKEKKKTKSRGKRESYKRRRYE